MAKSHWTKAEPRGCPLIDLVCFYLDDAAQKVIKNKGAPGIDGITYEQLPNLLRVHGEKIRQKLKNGTYIPAPVRRVDIPKPNGGTRMLGIPTLLDRTIQQAIVMTIGDAFEGQFSDKSYGFREGRNCRQAVQRAQEYIKDGNRWVVEMDLSKSFDRVNHDILMDRVSRVIDDKAILKLIRRYLNAGIMEDGLVSPRLEGVPQGSPLSPLLSNIMLTELDRELEKRGLNHVRYADDCNIYVKSEKAAQRVLTNITKYVEGTLKLRVNRDKSGTFRPRDSVFLGYTFSKANCTRIIVAQKSVKRLWTKLHKIFNTERGTSLGWTIKTITPVLRGWRNYYRPDDRKKYWEEMDERIRHHLRKLIWIAWKKPKTRERNLVKLGIDPGRAWKSSVNGRGAWWNSGQSHMNQAIKNDRFVRLGLYSLRFMEIR
ncbi:group II intron reverse transcriptase/maturase [Parasutterella sp.]|uniref:group II intron reverse transcriptase/maturase n=1 Tax=Parasutterella sp. TaxID=2049037 RepID=UPI00351FE404